MKLRTVCSVGYQPDVGYYRIPGIVRTEAGTLLVVCEARASASDWAGIDLTLLRSEDGGESWSEPVVLTAGIRERKTINNPVLFASGDGTVHLLYCVEYGLEGAGGVFYRKSCDDGRTWSDVREISADCEPKLHNVFAPGPGHGICRRNGQLLVPVWLVPKSAGVERMAHHPAEVRTLTSDDGGKRWTLSEQIPDGGIHDPNETAAAELCDGRVILNVRATRLGCRAQTIGDGQRFAPMRAVPELVDPTCFGSIAAAEIDGIHAVACVNCADQNARRNLTVSVSADGGTTWSAKTVITEGAAGYADLAIGPDGTMFVVFENETFSCLRLAVLPRADWLDKS